MVSKYRHEHNLTIKEFSNLTGLSTATISEIERGVGNPTLFVLETLAKVMSIPLTLMVQQEISNLELVRRKSDRQLIKMNNVNNLYETLSVSSVRSKIELMLLQLEPGDVSNDIPSVHLRQEEIAYVTSGTVTAYIQNDVITLYEGDTVRLLPGREHYFKNESDKTASIIFALEAL